MATPGDPTIAPSSTVKLKRFLFMGPTGAGKSKMVNCCYNRSIEDNLLKMPATASSETSIIGTTASISNYVDQRNKIVYVDTVGYGDVRFHQDTQAFLLFFRELICYSSIGFNGIFLFLRFGQITEDILVYMKTIEEMLGKAAFTRCTIVFTRCTQFPESREMFIDEQRKQHNEVATILSKVQNIIFGDMDTSDVSNNSDFDTQEKEFFKRIQNKKRLKFMTEMLKQIDQTDDTTLTLETNWLQYYSTKLKAFLGYIWEKIIGKPNELSELYKLSAGISKDTPLMIYYEECSICLELIIEIVNHSPKACITPCGHIFHYDCLKRTFQEKKACPNCRKDLRSLPERIVGRLIGLKEVQEPLKSNMN